MIKAILLTVGFGILLALVLLVIGEVLASLIVKLEDALDSWRERRKWKDD